MIAYLTTLAATVSVLLFILSIPIAQSAIGQALRRWAVGLMLAALFASFIVEFVRCAALGTWQVFRANPGEGILVLLIVSGIAYVALRIRRGPAPKTTGRVSAKQPFTQRRRDDDVWSRLRETLVRDDE